MADGDDLDPLERKFLRTNLINEGEDDDLRDEGGAWHHDADIDTNDTLAPVAAEKLGDGLSKQQKDVVQARYRMAQAGREYAGNKTGVKGVKAEYKEFKKFRAEEWALDKVGGSGLWSGSCVLCVGIEPEEPGGGGHVGWSRRQQGAGRVAIL